jgi:V8-like Glu-specific endopeptidase
MTGPTGTDDLHTPVTNIAVEDTLVTERLLSLPALGQVEALVPTDAGTEPLVRSVRPETTAAPSAPAVVLPDIGAASFAPEVQFETVHGFDDRVQVLDTAKYPWSAIASLLITARDGSQWIGTGWFVSPRTLVTAGHCVHITEGAVPGRSGWVKSIQVLPGRDGTALPFGSVTAERFWTVRGWVEQGNENYDYGAIVLPTPVGDTVGTFGFGVFGDGDLEGRVVNIAGYPGDKPAGTLWYDARVIASTNPATLHYDIDTAGGQSGAAVYLVEDDQRIAVAVHAYGGPTTNSGTRISAPVFKNLTDWKA